jgi:hypothetical protein
MSHAMTKEDGRTAEVTAAIAAHPEAKNLDQRDKNLLERVLNQHPGLSIDEALRDLKEAGM